VTTDGVDAIRIKSAEIADSESVQVVKCHTNKATEVVSRVEVDQRAILKPDHGSVYLRSR
jgi:hypothetical protein